MNNPLYFIFYVLWSAITFAGWTLGYVMAHSEVSRECERLGAFYVGPKTYICQIKGGHHRKHNRDDKRERWDFQPDWRDERDSDDDELPAREDDPPPANTFHISRQWVATV